MVGLARFLSLRVISPVGFVLNACGVDIPTPLVQQGDILAHFGFGPGSEDNTGMAESITNLAE